MKIQQFDYSMDLEQAILWQYDNAENLNSLIQLKQQWCDLNHTQFWQDWFNQVFNLQTATSFGLAVWCIILGIPNLQDPGIPMGPIWGFNEIPPINTNKNFYNSNFGSYPSGIILSLEDQRILLQLRYYQLTSRGDRVITNQALNAIFNNPNGIYQGGAWMIDNLDMTIDYVFNCPISTGLLNAIITYDVLPRPAAVQITNYITLE